jgi:hypothetical protein
VVVQDGGYLGVGGQGGDGLRFVGWRDFKGGEAEALEVGNDAGPGGGGEAVGVRGYGAAAIEDDEASGDGLSGGGERGRARELKGGAATCRE